MTTRATHHVARTVAFGLALACILAPTAPAKALNIILVFNSGASDAPAYDPTGSGLTSMFQFAETFYQDVFEDSHTLTINYWYDALSAGTRGSHSFVSESGPPWRETEANIKIATGRSWYIDPTPSDNSEFNMEQVLWRDLSATEKTNWFNYGANIPETFEAGFNGAAVPGGAADGLDDMLRTVIHEVGHALGMSGSATSTKNEVNPDGDYDFNPDFIFGRSLATEDDGTDIAHLANNEALMCGGCAQTSYRALPSHADLFTMASSLTFVNLDVPRREYYGGAYWNTDGNWSGDTKPGSADDVYVRDPGSVVTANLSANGVCRNLFVSEGGNVDTEGFKLDVGTAATIEGFNTDLFVRAGGEFEAGSATVSDQAEINMYGGLVDVNSLTLDAGTFLYGRDTTCTVDVQTKLTNNGTIRALTAGTLTFTSTGGAVWDLDGTGAADGKVEATGGNISFASGSLSDGFGGTMTISATRYISIAQPWELQLGTINLNGGADFANRARITGGTITATSGTIDANGQAHIDAPIVFDGANVSVAAAADVLELNNTTTFAGGGNFTGSGTIKQDGNATVTDDTTISVGVYDWDGNGGSTTTVNSGKTFTLNVTRLDAGNDTFDGTINLNGGTLDVDVADNSWAIIGTLNMNSASGTPTINGDQLVIYNALNVTNGLSNINANVSFQTPTVSIPNAADILQLLGGSTFNGGTYSGSGRLAVKGAVNIAGNTTIATTFRTIATTALTVPGGVVLTLNGPVEYYGDTLGGAGKITQNGDATVLNDTTINVDIYDWDGGGGAETTINSGQTLEFNVTSLDLGNDQFDGTINLNGGVLDVDVADNSWTMSGTLNMNSASGTPTINGDTMVINDTVNLTNGWSNINAYVQLINPTVTAPNAGDYVQLFGGSSFNGGSYTGNGRISVDNAVSIVGNTTIDFGFRTISGTNLTVNNGVELTLNGTIEYYGDTLGGAGTIHQNGDAEVRLNTTVNVGVYNWDGLASAETTVLTGKTFTLDVTNIDLFGTDVFNGTINNSGTIDVNVAATYWTMAGELNLSPGVVNGDEMRVTGNVNTSSGISRINADVDFNSTSNLNVAVGSRLIVVGDASFNSGSTITIPGQQMDLNGATTWSSPTSVTGNGAILQYGDATVTGNTTIATRIYDMDGSEGGPSTVTVNSGRTLALNVDMVDVGNDVYDGTLNLNGGILSVNNVANVWTMDGVLNMNSASGTPTVNGDQMIVTGKVNVTNGTSTINAYTYFNGAIVSTAAAPDILSILNGSRFAGGSYTGPGRINVGGNVLIDGTTTVDLHFRTNAGASMNTPSGRVLTLNKHIEYFGGTHVGPGTLNQNGRATVFGDTTINMSTYNWDGAGASQTIIQPGISLTFNVGKLNLGGNDTFGGTIDNNGTLSVNVSDNAWQLNGTMNVVGGLVLGDFIAVGGAINASGAAASTFNTVVDLENGGKITVTPGTTLDMNGAIRLNAGSAIHTDGMLRLDGPTTWNGTTSVGGTGTVYQGGNAVVYADTTIGVATYDWDGAGASTTSIGAGSTLTLNAGQLDFVGNVFDGTVNIDRGTLVVNVPAGNWTMQGTMDLSGGGVGAPALVDGVVMNVTETLNVDDEAHLYAVTVFQPTAVTALPNAGDTLRLFADAAIRAGATFGGNGTLVNVAGSTLTIESGAAVGVPINNAGTIELGASPGVAKIGGFSQTSLGSLNIDLDGLTPGTQHDQLIVTGSTVLNGTLNLSRGYRSAYRDRMNIITAGGPINGIFAQVGGVLQPGNQAFAVTYRPSDVNVTVTIPGDFDLDFSVGFSDFTYVAANYGKSGKSWVDGDADGDGKVTFPDFTYVAANYGIDVEMSSGSPAAAPLAGQVELVVDVGTGEMWLRGNAATLSGYNIASASGSLIPDADGVAAPPFQFYLSNLANDVSAASLAVGVGIDGDVALDPAYNTSGTMDLAFSYGVFGQGGSVSGDVIIVPEPTCLVLLGLGGVILSRRRRRRA